MELGIGEKERERKVEVSGIKQARMSIYQRLSYCYEQGTPSSLLLQRQRSKKES